MFKRDFLPPSVVVSENELFIIDNQKIEIPKCSLQFKPWKGKAINETFGNKPLINVDGAPMFAERQ